MASIEYILAPTYHHMLRQLKPSAKSIRGVSYYGHKILRNLQLHATTRPEILSSITTARRITNYKPSICSPEFVRSLTRNYDTQLQAITRPEILSPTTPDRRMPDYKPSIWTPEFVQSLRRDHFDKQDEYAKIERLTFDVKNMVDDEGLEPVVILELIDEIQRSGLGNQFGKEIKCALSRVVSNFAALELELHVTALGFRLFRQTGFLVSQDIFKKFMDEKGNFIESLSNDIKGMISLYEASYLAYEGEHLLDEAKMFTTKHLIHACSNKEEDKLLIDYVNHTLELPLRYRIPGLETRHYIETHSNKNLPALLELARFNFNRTQVMHQEDALEMFRWWKDVGLSDKLNFVRDRIMECFFWGIGTTSSPKPELSFCRKALTKVYKFVTILDDIYDVYGHIDELEHFNIALERWDINTIEDLPDYMKLTFLALYNSVNEIGYEILRQKGLNCIPSLKKAWVDMCKAFLVEAKWCYNKQTPTFEEYMNNGWVSISGTVALTHAFFLVSPEITPEALHCLNNNDDILRLPSMIFRLSNDLATSEAETERGETANAISCYAKQTGESYEDARKHLKKLIDESWKKLNKIQVDNETPFSKDFIETTFNLARTSQCAYQHGDGHGSPELIKKHILSILVHPLP